MVKIEGILENYEVVETYVRDETDFNTKITSKKEKVIGAKIFIKNDISSVVREVFVATVIDEEDLQSSLQEYVFYEEIRCKDHNSLRQYLGLKNTPIFIRGLTHDDVEERKEMYNAKFLSKLVPKEIYNHKR